MFRIVKVVSLPNSITVEFYYSTNGLWVQEKERAHTFFNERVVDDRVQELNKKADLHYCKKLSAPYQLTSYFKEEI